MVTRSRAVRLVLATLLVAVLAGCEYKTNVPVGDGPLRYRDEVFGTVTTTSNLVYGSAVGASGSAQDLKLDLYQPSGDTNAKRPAIVWVHGGSFRTGSKTSAEIVDEAKTFAKKGFVTISIDYRLDPKGCSAGAPSAQCVTAIAWAKEDAQAAVRWLRRYASTYKVDSTRIAIGGSSAGAITALNVGYDEDNPGSSGNPGYPSNVRAAISLSGARIFGTLEKDDAWALLFHGTSDVVVPYAWAQSTLSGLKDAGVTAEATFWDGAGHVPYAAHRTEIIDQTTNFLWWSMGLGTAST